jgi:hypothetical protein
MFLCGSVSKISGAGEGVRMAVILVYEELLVIAFIIFVVYRTMLLAQLHKSLSTRWTIGTT